MMASKDTMDPRFEAIMVFARVEPEELAEPAIQLLEYDDGPGSYGMRFCYYSLDGRFQRSPMMIDSTDTLEGLRAALKTTPKLRALLKRLVT